MGGADRSPALRKPEVGGWGGGTLLGRSELLEAGMLGRVPPAVREGFLEERVTRYTLLQVKKGVCRHLGDR